ncbi:MAG: GH3 auxin-responsive promoter family protein [Bacteroidales bacterium]
MAVLQPIINKLNTWRLNQIDSFRRDPSGTQETVLFKLLSRASSTEWGENHDYGSIKSITDYQKRVRIQTYEDIIPHVERLRQGEKNILWPGETKWFAKSSGTTNTKSKFIPVTNDSLEDCHYRGAKDVIAVYTCNRPDSRLFSGKGLILGGSHRINSFSNNSLYGDLSAILIENAPYWVNLFRTPKPEIALIEDFEEKLGKITDITINENITNISGVPSWYLVLIKQILEVTGKSDLHDVWPNLEVFFHGGISFAPYREQFRHFIKGQKMQYMETYNASEGFFGLQDDPSSPDMLLMLDLGIFFEFIPSCQLGTDNPAALTIGEVELNTSYAVVISTNGGLWRYMIGDTIQFTSLYPHKFIITGRTKHFINAFGEEVIIDNAEKALEAACNETGALIAEYTAGPVFTGTSSKGTHEWLIEFERTPDDIEKFISILDKTLMSVNSDYEAKRYKNLNLVRPIVRSLPRGTFYNWMREKNKLGGQNKVPRLSNNRIIIEEIYGITGMNV